MTKKSYLLDMDGVLAQGRTPIPGAQEFLARLVKTGPPFLVLTNNPMYTPRDLQHQPLRQSTARPLANACLAGSGGVFVQDREFAEPSVPV